MGVGLVGGYGGLLAIAARYLFPARAASRVWMYVAPADELNSGPRIHALPSGERVVITRGVDGLLALSSTCPHLGCQVHWEPAKSRFFCPCHNGTFDAEGAPTGGPPLKDETPLIAHELQVEDGLLFIRVPVEDLP